MVCILATLKIQDGKQTEFETIFTALAAAVRANEEGNLFYQLCRDASDPTTYVVMEAYVDQAAVEAHRKTDHFRSKGREMGGCLAGAPEIRFFEGVG